MICSVGCEKTFCDLLPKYPGLVLIPIFSCFTFGPIDGKSSKCCDLSCQNGEKSLGVSFALTWLNMCITAISVIPLIFSYSSYSTDYWGPLSYVLIAGKMIFFAIIAPVGYCFITLRQFIVVFLACFILFQL